MTIHWKDGADGQLRSAERGVADAEKRLSRLRWLQRAFTVCVVVNVLSFLANMLTWGLSGDFPWLGVLFNVVAFSAAVWGFHSNRSQYASALELWDHRQGLLMKARDMVTQEEKS